MTELVKTYRAMLSDGTIDHDPAQALLIEKLELLANRITAYQPPARTDIFSYFTKNRGEIPKGLYIFGSVGRGKTLAMDMFFETIPTKRKRRVHFHEFMLDVHSRIKEARDGSKSDPLKIVAKSIANETLLLCFDELHVTDITDAMVLGRLFDQMLELGMIIVATSNAHPQELYKDGLNRQLFLPFVDLIENHLEVYKLDADRDFRLEKLSGQTLYFLMNDGTARQNMDAVWENMTGGHDDHAHEIELNGRMLIVPRAAMGSARFEFADLCENPLGAEDYLTLAHAFHTIFIDHIPILTPERRNEARRFINLIDTLYDNRVKLIVSAEAEPTDLYPKGTGADLFERTTSRLIEMRSEEYLASPHGT